MSKVQFQVARQYIEEGNYDKAREILLQLEHPSAQKWLDKIDELDPPFPNVTPSPVATYRKPSRRNQQVELTDKELRYLKRDLERKRSGRIVGLFFVGSFVVCGSISMIMRLFNTNFARPTEFLEFAGSSFSVLCVLVIVVPLFIYLWNQEI